MTTKQNLLKGFFKENPVLVYLLGMCSALAVTKSVESALGMGLLVLFVLICSNVVISLIKKFIPDEVRIPCYIVVIALFVTIVKLFCQAFLFDLYESLGVFLSLIVVNCIVLGRAEAYASKNNVFDSFIDGLGMGIGYIIAMLIISIFREVLGTGGITFGLTLIPLNSPVTLRIFPSEFALKFLVQSTGGFISLGVILAIIAAITLHKKAKEEKK